VSKFNEEQEHADCIAKLRELKQDLALAYEQAQTTVFRDAHDTPIEIELEPNALIVGNWCIYRIKKRHDPKSYSAPEILPDPGPPGGP
jgi:hypothetical protein